MRGSMRPLVSLLLLVLARSWATAEARGVCKPSTLPPIKWTCDPGQLVCMQPAMAVEALAIRQFILERSKSSDCGEINWASNPCNWYGVVCGANGPGGAVVVNKLFLSSSGLEGPFGTLLFNLKYLTWLNLGGNGMTGGIGRGIGNWNRMVYLNLAYNNLTGPLPPEMGFLGALEELNLRNNKLSGVVPGRIYGLRKLSNLDLGRNQFTGSLPQTFVKSGVPVIPYSRRLVKLDLGGNVFTGQVPGALGSLTDLTTLDLHSNRLKGPIPGSFGQLKKLGTLDLSSNDISGNVPPQFAQLDKLTSLNISRNNLSYIGPPVANFFDGLADTLVSLDLSFNSLYANLHLFPRLTSLTYLNLDRNKFATGIPKTISALAQLRVLHLSYNQLISSIPVEVALLTELESLHLASNQLSSTLPKFSCVKVYNSDLMDYSVTRLLQLNVRNNRLSGGFPGSNFCAGLAPDLLDISNNLFGGRIPKLNDSFVSRLNVSHNQFTGDLNYSPGGMAGGYSGRGLLSFDASYNKLFGSIPEGLRKFGASAFEGNTDMCGPPLAKLC